MSKQMAYDWYIGLGVSALLTIAIFLFIIA
jgi:hypothetical protein